MKLRKKGHGRLNARATRAAIAAARKRARKSHRSLANELARYGYHEIRPKPKPKKRTQVKATPPRRTKSKPTKQRQTRPAPQPTYQPTSYQPSKFRGPLHDRRRPVVPGRTRMVQQRLRTYPDGHTAAIYEVAFFFKAPLADRSAIASADWTNTGNFADWLENQKQKANEYLQQFKLRKSDPDFLLYTSFGAYLVDPKTGEMRQPFFDQEKDLRDVEADDFDDDAVIPKYYLAAGWRIAGIRLYISPQTGDEWQKHVSAQSTASQPKQSRSRSSTSKRNRRSQASR